MQKPLTSVLFVCAVAFIGGLDSTSGYSLTLTRNAKAVGGHRLPALPSRHAVPRKIALAMHLGHSHSDHSHENELVNGAASPAKPLHKKRRRLAIFLFAALAILGAPLARKRSIGRADVAAFVMTSAALSMFDAVRREVKHAITKIRGFRDGIAKHSSPIDAGTLWNYFFRNDNAADRVTLLGGIINLLLSLGKFGVGITCHSSALIADAGHSLSDLFSDCITLWAVQIGRLPPDDDHPYGHGKFEAVGSLFLGMTLLGTGISVGAVANKKLIEIISAQRTSGFAAAGSLAGKLPTMPALLMAGLSIFSKEWLYRITQKVGEKLNSQVVIANAWHHRSDAYSSVLALVAIGLAMFSPGLLAADSAAGILVAGMICLTGMDIIGESIKQLTDTSNEQLVEKVSAVLAESDDVFEVKRVRARQVGSSAIVDVNISTSGDLPSSASRNIEERLRYQIMEVPGVVDTEVHATSPEVVCPLLIANEVSEDPPSATELENNAREVVLSHPDVSSVEGITLHYEDALFVNVDVDIRLGPEVTFAKAHTVAEELRQSLETSSKVHKASIFLDLNKDAKVMQ